jgi:hypothetical protein
VCKGITLYSSKYLFPTRVLIIEVTAAVSIAETTGLEENLSSQYISGCGKYGAICHIGSKRGKTRRSYEGYSIFPDGCA